jgi:hypothetical protein
MAKKLKIPKKVAGIKVPKRIRKSGLLRGLLASRTGREIASKALIAGAAAAAAALVAERDEVAGASKRAGRKGARNLARLSEAAESGIDAAFGVVTEAARSLMPEKPDRAERKRRSGDWDELRH